MSGCPFNTEQLAQLKAFISVCQREPSLLHHPKLNFFKDFLLSLGAVVPPAATFNAEPSGDANPPTSNAATEEKSSDISDEESDVELDMAGITVSEPLDAYQEMGDPSKEPTEEEQNQSVEKRSEAMCAFSDQQFDVAIQLYSEAILLNPQSALLFAKRGQVYLKLNKLHSCIKDCTYALELNCDSAAAYKFRGRAYRLLGKFEEASQDLCESLKIDYDDQTNEWLQEVKPNAEKLRQHKLSVQRNKEEKEHRAKIRRVRKAEEASKAAAAASRAAAEAAAADDNGGMFGGFKDKGRNGAGAGTGNLDFASLLMDPDVIEAFQDPEVATAFLDVSGNPANFVKYENNPKIKAIIEKLQSKLGNEGVPGYFAGATPKPPTDPKEPTADDDVGLD